MAISAATAPVISAAANYVPVHVAQPLKHTTWSGPPSSAGMIAFHGLIATGLPAAEALATAQQQVRGDEAVEGAAASFVCLGAGTSHHYQTGHWLQGRR